MELIQHETVPVTVDVLCDVCSNSTSPTGASPQFGTLSTHWGYGSAHDGERYEVHLCENCFFMTLAGIRRERLVNQMFENTAENAGHLEQVFGLKDSGNYFKD